MEGINEITQKLLDNITALKQCISHNDIDGVVKFQLRLTILNTEYGQHLAKEINELADLEANREIQRARYYNEAILMGHKNSPADTQARAMVSDLTAELSRKTLQIKSLHVLAQNTRDVVSSTQTYIGYEKAKRMERV